MDKELAKEWADALRSGVYEQTQENLRCPIDEDGTLGYCCIGVLCDITKALDWDSREVLNDDALNLYAEDLGGYGPTSNLNMDDLPEYLMEDEELDGFMRAALGMTSGEQKEFIQANDDRNADFMEIADMVDKTYGVER